MGERVAWSREDIIVAYALYCITPLNDIRPLKQIDTAGRLWLFPLCQFSCYAYEKFCSYRPQFNAHVR